MLRAATDADRDAVVSLALAEEASWFGCADSSETEVVEYLDAHGGIAGGVVLDDDRLHGFALASAEGNGVLFLDPAAGEDAFAPLFAWLCAHGARCFEAYSGDARRTAWLEARGLRHTRSMFDVTRAGADPVPAPRWPAGVDVVAYRLGEDDAAVYRLVYDEAGWADIPGHVRRSFETWRAIFSPLFQGWVARRADRPVGFVIGRVLQDGRAWIYQLAVARDERGAGLGRALLLHAYDRMLSSGATSLGLNVQAANDHAIGLYRSVGLEVTREWRTFEATDG